MAQKCDKINNAKLLLLDAEEGISVEEIADSLNVTVRTAQRYVEELNAPIYRKEGVKVFYHLEPDEFDLKLSDVVTKAIRRVIQRNNPPPQK